MTHDETRRRLTEAGRTPVPPVDAAFADTLEQRLRAVHATLPTSTPRRAGAAHAPGATPRAWWRSPAPVAAAMALLVAVAIGNLVLRPSGVQLAAAFDATVRYPDGRVVEARPGLVLAEGAVVRTGQAGHVVVDGVRVGPGETVVVDDGRLRPVAQPAPVQPSEEPGRPAPTQRPSARPSPTTGLLPALPGTSPRPEPDRSPPSQPTDTAPSEQPGTVQGEQEEIHVGGAPADERHAIALTAVLRERQVELRWSGVEERDFGSWVLLKSPAPDSPTWPPSGATEVLAKIDDPKRLDWTDADLRDRPVYRVVLLDREGREIARSRPVTPDARPEDKQAVAERHATK